MFIWTYKALCLSAMLALGGCTAALLPFEGGNLGVAERVTLRGGVVVTGPSGYCIDRLSAKSTQLESAVSVFRCDRIGTTANADSIGGRMFTATATAGTVPNFVEFRQFIKSNAGRTMLSPSANAKDIQIQRTRRDASALYVEYINKNASPHLGPLAWKAFVNIRGNLAVLSLYQGVGDPVNGKDGENALRDFVKAVQAANQSSS